MNTPKVYTELPSSAYIVMPSLKDYKIERLLGRNYADHVIECVYNYFEISVEFKSIKSRRDKYVFPRQVCMYFIKMSTKMTLKEISDIFGGLDHTTVIYAVKRIGNFLTVPSREKEQIDTLDKILKQTRF